MPTKTMQKGEVWHITEPHVGDVVIPDGADCAIVGEHPYAWGSQIRGRLIGHQARVTVHGVTVYEGIDVVSLYQSEFRSCWTKSLRVGGLGAPAHKWPSNVLFDGCHVHGPGNAYGSSEDGVVEIHAGDITLRGGSIERVTPDAVHQIDGGDDYSAPLVEGTRFECDTQTRFYLGAKAIVNDPTLVLVTLDARSGAEVRWNGRGSGGKVLRGRSL